MKMHGLTHRKRSTSSIAAPLEHACIVARPKPTKHPCDAVHQVSARQTCCAECSVALVQCEPLLRVHDVRLGWWEAKGDLVKQVNLRHKGAIEGSDIQVAACIPARGRHAGDGIVRSLCGVPKRRAVAYAMAHPAAGSMDASRCIGDSR